MSKLVLIIDNHDSDVASIAYTSRQWGFEPYHAKDMAQAQTLLEEKKFFLVFMNVTFPKLETEEKIVGISDLQTESVLQIIRLNPCDLVVRPVKSSEVSLVFSKALGDYSSTPNFPAHLANIFNLLSEAKHKDDLRPHGEGECVL